MLTKIKDFSWLALPALFFFISFPRIEYHGVNLNSGSVLGAYSAQTLGSSAPGPAVLPRSPTIAMSTSLDTSAVKRPYQANFSRAPSLSAKSAMVYDLDSGAVLYSKDITSRLPIASLTKLMTAAVAIADPAFSQPIIITKQDILNTSPALHLLEGDSVLPADLLKAMIVGSANDAAQTLANHLPDKTIFVQKMNEKARVLGMENTHFNTAVGFDIGSNYSSADDLSKLTNYALRDLPYDSIWQKQDYSFASKRGGHYAIQNSNGIIKTRPEIKSIKTGYSPYARGSMIVMAKSPKSGAWIITIVIGSENRDKDVLSLVDYILDNFAWK